MAVVVLTSATGSPGTTTAAVGLTLSWPRDVLLADCDREPSQAVQAGYLRGVDHGGRGLGAVARLNRERQPVAPHLLRVSLPLDREETDLARHFLPGFSHPGAVGLFDHVWPELATAFARLEETGMDVIVDAGHVGPDGLALPLLAEADAVCLVTRTTLRSLASTRLYLALLREQLDSLPAARPLGMLLVGPGRPYSAAEIVAEFDVPCWGEVPWNERHAAVLSEGAEEPRRFPDTTLMNQLRVIASRLTERVGRHASMRHHPGGMQYA